MTSKNRDDQCTCASNQYKMIGYPSITSIQYSEENENREGCTEGY